MIFAAILTEKARKFISYACNSWFLFITLTLKIKVFTTYLMFKTFECSRDPLLRKLFGNRCSYIQFFVIFLPSSQWTVRVKESSPLIISAPRILVVSKSRFRFAAYYIKLVARNLSKSQCVYKTIPRNTTAWQLRKKTSFFGFESCKARKVPD